MAVGTTSLFSARWVVGAATLLSLIVSDVAAQDAETCTSVTVTGGEFPGVYEQGTGSSARAFVGAAAGSTHILQAVTFGVSRARRNLGGGGGGIRRRGLANDCLSQMWILTDTSAVGEDGFPYYSTFDCAEHPASAQSTWVRVDCEDCSEVAPIVVVCTSAVGSDTTLGSGDGGGGGGGALTLPVIIGIAGGGLVLLLCLGFCFSRHKKRAHKGSHTFADDSAHSMAQQKSAAAGGGAAVGGAPHDAAVSGSNGPVPTYTAAVGETVESPLAAAAAAAAGGGGGAAGRSGGLGLIAKGTNSKSFKPSQGPSAYDGIFATRSSAGGGGGNSSSQGGTSATTTAHPPVLEMRSKFASPELRKDSMAAAAVAAAASAAAATSRSQGGGGGSGMHDVDIGSPTAFANVLSSGVVGEGGPAGGPRGARGTPPKRRPSRAQKQQQQQGARGAGLEGEGEGGITWSAGQNLSHRRGYQASDFGGDSAAGSVYELQTPDNDGNDMEHTYNDDGCVDSVAASSPGAYSIYSHYTTGGGMFSGGGGGGGGGGGHDDAWSSDEGDSSRPENRRADGGGGGGSQTRAIPSPAGLVARNSLRGGSSPPGGAEGADNTRR